MLFGKQEEKQIKPVKYYKCTANWDDIYNTILTHKLTGKVLHFIFVYKTPVKARTIMIIQQPINNSKVVGIFDNCDCMMHTFADDDNDNKDDNNFQYDHDDIIPVLKDSNLLGQELQIFTRESTDKVKHIIWCNDKITTNVYPTTEFHCQEISYVIVNNSIPKEIDSFLQMKPAFVFIGMRYSK